MLSFVDPLFSRRFLSAVYFSIFVSFNVKANRFVENVQISVFAVFFLYFSAFKSQENTIHSLMYSKGFEYKKGEKLLRKKGEI